ncbi:MAG: ASKHA domain-containing protein [Bacillota bacterium]|nr:ASKHA domain-containing protein [Bacillota bacterium]
MVQVNFYPENKKIIVDEGTTILQAAGLAGVLLESPCNSNLTCGKCKVRLDEVSIRNVISSGKHHLTHEEISQGFVLACSAKIIGDISVEIINKEQNDTLKILSEGKGFDIKIKTSITKKYFENDSITRVYLYDKELGSEAFNTEDKIFGIVVDIGTTTMVTSLIDLREGKELGSISSLNPQAIHAQDVLSRIKFASDKDGLEKLNKGVIDEINNMIIQLCKNSGIDFNNIYEAIFSGNTCMLHLAAKVDPSSLGKFPYNPKLHGGNHIIAKDHKLSISPLGVIYFPPIISAYVGADIASGILASRLHEEKGITLFVDIGTNGEMAIALDGQLSATSTAAGPAFEGMNITHGMRAAHGAIEFFNVEEDGKITVKTIGNKEAIGICGSGLIDIVGELVANGLINKSGKFVDFNKADLSSILKEKLVKLEGKTVFRITDKVYLSQKDIRQVQLAKGAVRAGIEFLLKSRSLKADDVEKVLIAGSFGYHLRAKSLINIGLLPSEFKDKIDFIGNTSKSGGQIFLLNTEYREKMVKIVKSVDVIELSSYKEFDKVFVQSLSF